MRQFTWWRRFYSTQKLPKQYLFKGASELQQRIEFGEYEFNHLGREVYLEDAIYEAKLKQVIKASPWLTGKALDERMDYDRKQRNKRIALIMKNHLEIEDKTLAKLIKDLATEFKLTNECIENIMEDFDGTTRALYFKCKSIAQNKTFEPAKMQRLIRPQPMHMLKPKERQYAPLWQQVIQQQQFEHKL